MKAKSDDIVFIRFLVDDWIKKDYFLNWVKNFIKKGSDKLSYVVTPKRMTCFSMSAERKRAVHVFV